MSNPYFWTGNYQPLSRLTSARSEQVQSIFQAVEAGFNQLPDPGRLQNDSQTYCDDAGTANNYVVTLPLSSSQVALSAYAEGLHIRVKIANTNTGPSTFNANGIGSKSITYANGAPLTGAELVAGMVAEMTFDGAVFQLENPMVSVAGVAAYAASAAASAALAASFSPITDPWLVYAMNASLRAIAFSQ